MRYMTPELRELGSFASLTLGNNGSCPDGNGENDQVGGGVVGGAGTEPCGSSGDAGGGGATNGG